VTSFDFVGHRRRFAFISMVLVSVSLFGFLANGMNLSIDFVGGTSFLVTASETDATADEIGDAVTAVGATDVQTQISQGDGEVGVIVKVGTIEVGSDLEANAIAALIDVVGNDADVDVTTVGASWGKRISGKALEALIVFLIVVVLYISMRLEPKMAIAAVLALIHDVGLTIGVYAVLGFTISPSTVIALLTILGYSLYDSVVVFDRVEENVAQLGSVGRRSYAEAVNTSLNEVLWRSLNTSITSLLPVGALLFVGAQLLGADTLQDLALALFVGMALGAYSSIFIAAPFLVWLKEREPAMAELAAKLEKKIATGEAEKVDAAAVIQSRAPVTTDYVRGRGRKNKKRK
jgi:preprotein translocase subunit SecF